MDQISLYLEKFKTIGSKREKVFKIVHDAVKSETGIELTKEEVRVDNSIKISKSGSEKAEIFLNKKKIEERISRDLEREFNITGGKGII